MDKKVWLIIFYQVVCFNFLFASSPSDARADRWVDSVYNELSDTERIAQLIVEKVDGDNLSVSTYDKKIPSYGIIVDGNPDNDTREYLKYKRNLTSVPYLQFNNQLTALPTVNQSLNLPAPMTLAAVQDNNTLYDLFTAQARKLTSLNFNGFVDSSVRIDYKHGDLLFSYEPDNVGYSNSSKIFKSRTKAFAEENINLMYKINMELFTEDILKYIPDGIYDTENWQQVNRNHPLVVLDVNAEQLTETRNSKFNRLVVDGLFRENLKYRGPLVANTDSYRNYAEIDELYLIEAGYDLVVTSRPNHSFNNLYKAWKKRKLRNKDLEEKVKKVLKYKFEKGVVSSQTLTKEKNSGKGQNNFMAHSIYECYGDAISLIKNENKALPVRILENNNFASLSIGNSNLTTFQSTLEKYAPFAHFAMPAHEISAEQLSGLVQKLSAFDEVVVGVHGPLNNLLLKFLSLLDDNTQLTSAFFNNMALEDLKSVSGNFYLAYEDNEITQELVPQMIFGARSSQGVYPITESNGNTYGLRTDPIGRLAYGKSHGVGINQSALQQVDQIALEAINEGATPGCQVLVAKDGKVVYEKAFGTYSYDNHIPVQTRSIYDVASITKVAATTQIITFLADRGVIDLDDTLGEYLPELKGSNKNDLVIRDVLAHQAGLKAFLPIWQNTLAFRHTGLDLYSDVNDDSETYEVGFGMYANPSLKDSIWQWTIKSDLRRENRNGNYDYRYSDLGFYMLKELAERVINQPFDEFLHQNLYEPMGMHATTFNPLCKNSLFDIVPTEDDKDFRQSMVWGTVHDEIAAMNGGVSGHAGLFSNVNDLAKLGQMHLQGGHYGDTKYFSPQIIDAFTSYQGNGDSRRGYGWDKPAKNEDGYNPASEHASTKTFGHRGFTGTVVWIDPEFDLIYVFLSNRVHPDVVNNKLNELHVRKRIHDAVYESIYEYDKYIN